MIARSLTLLLFVVMATVLAGAVSSQPAAETDAARVGQTAEAPADAASHALVWPARLALRDSSARGIVHEYPPARGWGGLTVGAGRDASVLPDTEALIALAGRSDLEQGAIRYEGPSAHLAGVLSVRAGERRDGFDYFVCVSLTESSDEQLRLGRTWFRYRSPRRAVGTVVLMPGMLGTPEPVIDGMERSLLTERWAVLRMLVPPSPSTERFRIELDTAGDAQQQIAPLAEELDHRTAECVYAVHTMLDHLAGRRDFDADLPIAVVGMSGTGMMLPAVVAYEPDRFAASVIIGGGGNAFRILRESSYAGLLDAAGVSWKNGRPSDQEIARFDDAYLRAARLDGLSVADAAQAVPTLMIHASRDRAVPAVCGDLLWEAFGQPERWISAIGHELLFVRIAFQTGDIIEWLNEAVEPEP